jgi:hypothetical protein
MDNQEQITKADLAAALTEFKTELKAELLGDIRIVGDDLTSRLQQKEANLIAAFRSYD